MLHQLDSKLPFDYPFRRFKSRTYRISVGLRTVLTGFTPGVRLYVYGKKPVKNVKVDVKHVSRFYRFRSGFTSVNYEKEKPGKT